MCLNTLRLPIVKWDILQRIEKNGLYISSQFYRIVETIFSSSKEVLEYIASKHDEIQIRISYDWENWDRNRVTLK